MTHSSFKKSPIYTQQTTDKKPDKWNMKEISGLKRKNCLQQMMSIWMAGPWEIGKQSSKDLKRDLRSIWTFSWSLFTKPSSRMVTVKKLFLRETVRKGWVVSNYSRTGLKWSVDRFYGVMNKYLSFLVHIVISMYRGGQEWGTTMNVCSHLFNRWTIMVSSSIWACGFGIFLKWINVQK